jgi:hypothetical protein
MKDRNLFRTTLTIASIIALMLACASTPDSRISEKQSLFDSYSEEVQSNLRQGKVDVGYDEDMVQMALGEPDETSVETSEAGETVMWGYTRSRPAISIGLGGGSLGGMAEWAVASAWGPGRHATTPRSSSFAGAR